MDSTDRGRLKWMSKQLAAMDHFFTERRDDFQSALAVEHLQWNPKLKDENNTAQHTIAEMNRRLNRVEAESRRPLRPLLDANGELHPPVRMLPPDIPSTPTAGLSGMSINPMIPPLPVTAFTSAATSTSTATAPRSTASSATAPRSTASSAPVLPPPPPPPPLIPPPTGLGLGIIPPATTQTHSAPPTPTPTTTPTTAQSALSPTESLVSVHSLKLRSQSRRMPQLSLGMRLALVVQRKCRSISRV